MSRKKKKPQQDHTSKIILVTVLIELIKAIIELITNLKE